MIIRFASTLLALAALTTLTVPPAHHPPRHMTVDRTPLITHADVAWRAGAGTKTMPHEKPTPQGGDRAGALTARWCRALVVTWLAVAALPALAWGPHGHQAVGAIADQLIAGTATAKKVRQVLGGNLQMASVWADCVRAVESSAGSWAYTKSGTYKECALFENEASQAAMVAFVKRNASRCGGFASHAQCRHKAYHFTDIPVQHDQYDPALPGANSNDLVQAIGATITVLQGGKSPAPINIAGQREALRLLAHYIGDLHQPLHVGSIYLNDAGQALNPTNAKEARDHDNAGGNQLLLKGWKLHAVWDDVPGKLITTLMTGPGATEARQVKRATGPMNQWPTAWASDTLADADLAYKGLKIAPKAGDTWVVTATEPDYRLAREALQRAQIVKAGARLAQIVTTLWP